MRAPHTGTAMVAALNHTSLLYDAPRSLATLPSRNKQETKLATTLYCIHIGNSMKKDNERYSNYNNK